MAVCDFLILFIRGRPAVRSRAISSWLLYRWHLVGALAYAYNIVWGPTPRAMRWILDVCARFARDFEIIFNAKKSNVCGLIQYRQRKTLVIHSFCWWVVY